MKTGACCAKVIKKRGGRDEWKSVVMWFIGLKREREREKERERERERGGGGGGRVCVFDATVPLRIERGLPLKPEVNVQRDAVDVFKTPS